MRGCGAMKMPNRIQVLAALWHVRFLLAILTCALATSALAVEPEKAAASLARQAGQVEDGGDAKRAAELYLEAFQTDPTQPNYLYAAARSEMNAGKVREAEEHFEQFLTLADTGTDRADKARAYLADLRGSRAETKESAADRAAAAGRWQEASKLYEELWNQMPTRWSALFKAGQAAQEAGDKERARELLRQYLNESPTSAADRPEADDRLRRLAASGEAKSAAPVGVSGQAESGSGGRVLGWTLLGTGVAMLGGGAALLLYGVSQERALNQELKLVDGFVTADMTHAQAQSRADAIGQHQTIGVGLAAAGVVAAGFGTWLMLREPDKQPTSRVSVAPGPGWTGVSLGWRF